LKKLRENSQRTKKLRENLPRDLRKYTNNSKTNSREITRENSRRHLIVSLFTKTHQTKYPDTYHRETPEKISEKFTERHTKTLEIIRQEIPETESKIKFKANPTKIQEISPRDTRDDFEKLAERRP